MIFKNILFVLASLVFSGESFLFAFEARSVLRGVVLGRTQEGTASEMPGLPFASVYWSGTSKGVTTDEDGKFEIHKPSPSRDYYLVVSYIGYSPDTILVEKNLDYIEIILSESVQLEEVTVRKRMGGSFISQIEPLKTEVITVAGLQSLACCNLSESFENSATVDVGFSDAISGAKRIQMLGLSGVYSQLMFENIPGIRGLSTSYGLTYIPGTWMESIQISKGSSSVLNGYESVSGQINVEYKKPQRSETFFLNLFGNDEGRLEANVNSAVKVNDRWSTMILGHFSTLQTRLDHNNDGFLDVPLSTQINLMNRWNYEVEGKSHVQFGIHLLSDERAGGQTGFNTESDRGTTNAYGIGIDTRRIQGFLKAGFFLPNTLRSSIAFMGNFSHYDQGSFFGLNEYIGKQQSLFANIVFQTILGNTNHKLNGGIGYMRDVFEENFNSVDYSRTESVPGVFGEYTYTNPDRLTLILGFRADHHNVHDWFLTPRIHFRYQFNENNVLRGSAGKGYRTANIFPENMAIMASSRELVVQEEFKAEEAWNYGMNFTRTFPLSENRKATFSLDLYRTDFQNQIIGDIDQDATRIFFYNLDGRSYSNSFQTDLTLEILTGFEISSAFRLNDVKTTLDGRLVEMPLVSKYKGLVTLSYATRWDKWKFDMTNQFNGRSRLPETGTNPPEYRLSDYSQSYYVLHAQVTRRFRQLDVYLGGENLTNFKQHNPILSATNPFGPYFDSTIIWGPVLGRMFYAGIRYTIK